MATRVAPRIPEPFVPDKRRAMTPARKRRIWEAWGGCCWRCRLPVPERGPGVVYDHIDQLWVKGSDADEDIGPSHKACDVPKTAADAKVRAHIKRIIKKNTEPKKPSRLQGRGFDKSKTRGFDGKVRVRG